MQVFKSRVVGAEVFHVNQTTRLVVTLRGVSAAERASAERALLAFAEALSIRFESSGQASSSKRIA